MNNSWIILVVDDDENARKAVINTLTKPEVIRVEGVSPGFLQAGSAAEAKLLLKGMPDIVLVILDIVMEDSGFEVITYLREELNNHSTQIIVRSGQANKTLEKPEGKIIIPTWEEIIKRYNINGIIEKFGNTELSERLSIISQTLAGLRAYRQIMLIQDKNDDLRFVLTEIEALYNKDVEKLKDKESGLQSMIDNLVRYKSDISKIQYCLTGAAREKLTGLYQNRDIVNLSRLLFNTLENCPTGTVTPAMIDEQIKNESKHALTWKPEKLPVLFKLYELLMNKMEVDMEAGPVQVALIGETDFSLFEKHHTGYFHSVKINWLGTREDLMYLYYCCVERGLMKDKAWKSIHTFLKDHYLYQGRPISPNTIKTGKCQKKDPDKKEILWASMEEVEHYQLISEIIQALIDYDKQTNNQDN